MGRSTTAPLRFASRSAALVAAFVLVGASILVHPGVARATYGTSFDLWNLSGGELKVEGWYAHPTKGVAFPPKLPPAGTRIPVGQNLQIDVATTRER